MISNELTWFKYDQQNFLNLTHNKAFPSNRIQGKLTLGTKQKVKT